MAEIHGMGHSIKRKEDPRFLQGKGNYVDDIKLPDMLYLDIVRSPYAHARIKSIKTDKALKVPGVLAVVTGKDLEKYNLAWMPTLMSDKQMVLPVDTVKYQAQEVAAVLATVFVTLKSLPLPGRVRTTSSPALMDSRAAKSSCIGFICGMMANGALPFWLRPAMRRKAASCSGPSVIRRTSSPEALRAFMIIPPCAASESEKRISLGGLTACAIGAEAGGSAVFAAANAAGAAAALRASMMV